MRMLSCWLCALFELSHAYSTPSLQLPHVPRDEILTAVEVISSSPLIRKTVTSAAAKEANTHALIAGTPLDANDRPVCDPCHICGCARSAVEEKQKTENFGLMTGKLKPELLPDWQGCKDYECFTSLICTDYATVPSNPVLKAPDCRGHFDLCVPTLSPVDSRLKFVMNLAGVQSYCLFNSSCNHFCANNDTSSNLPVDAFAPGTRIRCDKGLTGGCEARDAEALMADAAQRSAMLKKSIEHWADMDDYLYAIHEAHQKKPQGVDVPTDPAEQVPQEPWKP